MNEKRKKKRQRDSGVGIALGLVFGSGIGLIFGLVFGEAMFGDAGAGLVMGQGFGLIFGIVIESTRRRPNEDNKSCDQPPKDIDIETQTKENRSAWGKFRAFMRCVYRRDQQAWKSIFGGRC
jgi:hypothetical protein